ncbi:MAG: hypothetical protein ACFCU1_11130 [Sumerlaeia bacterium]
MKKLLKGFGKFRKVVTLITLVPIVLVCFSIGYEYLVEGYRMDAPGANIGLGLLKLLLPVIVAAWLLWLLPPYDWAHRKLAK